MGTRTRGSRSSRDSRKHRGVGPPVQNEFRVRDGRDKNEGAVRRERSAYGALGRVRRPAGKRLTSGGCVRRDQLWVLRCEEVVERPRGYILPSRTFNDLFTTQYPQLIAPDATT